MTEETQASKVRKALDAACPGWILELPPARRAEGIVDGLNRRFDALCKKEPK